MVEDLDSSSSFSFSDAPSVFKISLLISKHLPNLVFRSKCVTRFKNKNKQKKTHQNITKKRNPENPQNKQTK